MPDSLGDLLNRDSQSERFFHSLPMFIQDQLKRVGGQIQSREELGGLANEMMREGLKMDEYNTMYEDETDSDIDLM